MSEDTATENMAFTGSDGQPLVGKEERARFMGYETIKEPKTEPEPEKIYEGPKAVENAANDHARERGDGQPDIVERRQHRPHGADPNAKFATDVRTAAAELSADHRLEQLIGDIQDVTGVQQTVDVARTLMNEVAAGRITMAEAQQLEREVHAELAAEQQQQSQPQVEAPIEQPQPEASEPPPSGVSERVRAMLSDPELRGVLEPELQKAEQSRRLYENATGELATIATASVMAQFPELQQYNAHQLPAVLSYMAQKDPGRYQEIMSHLSRAQALVNANNQARQQETQIRNAQLSQWAAREAEHFDQMIANEPAERRQAIRSEIDQFGKENGLSFEQIKTIFSQNPAMASAAFQKLIWDGLAHRVAVRTAKAYPASRNQIPQVQKPGIGRTRADDAAAEVGALRDRFKKATGNEQIKLAVELQKMQRRARG